MRQAIVKMEVGMQTTVDHSSNALFFTSEKFRAIIALWTVKFKRRIDDGHFNLRCYREVFSNWQKVSTELLEVDYIASPET